MARGKTTQPLTIWVAAQWREHPKVLALIDAGHDVEWFPGLRPPDLILHPAAWRWGEWAWPWLEGAVKEARRARRA